MYIEKCADCPFQHIPQPQMIDTPRITNDCDLRFGG